MAGKQCFVDNIGKAMMTKLEEGGMGYGDTDKREAEVGITISTEWGVGHSRWRSSLSSSQ